MKVHLGPPFLLCLILILIIQVEVSVSVPSDPSLKSGKTNGNANGSLYFPLSRKWSEKTDHENNYNLRSGWRWLEGFKEYTFTKRENDGVYYADIRIGTPPQTFTVIVDTGSATIAVPCQGCSCGNHNHFDVSKSSTGKGTGGRYRQCYSEGSCNEGSLIREKICIGDKCTGDEAVDHTFGCCSKFASAFKTQEADGIIGLSGSSGTLISDLRSHHKLEDNVFSVCFGHGMGGMSVGGYSDDRHLEPVQWVPMVSQASFYKVQVKQLYVNGQAIKMTSTIPIVDSGTTFTYVNSQTHDLLRKSFDTFCGASAENCPGQKNPPNTPKMDTRDAVYCYSKPEDMDYLTWTSKYPSIDIEFDSNRICAPASSYFFKSKDNIFCVGYLRDSRSRMVIGAISMIGFDVIFDHDNNRVGWAKALCDKEQSFDDVGRYNCCGSCAIARANGFKPGHQSEASLPVTDSPTVAPTRASVPITDSPTAGVAPVTVMAPTREPEPMKTEAPSTAVTEVISQTTEENEWLVKKLNRDYMSAAKPAEQVLLQAKEILLVDFSTTLCMNADDPVFVFEKGSKIRVTGEGTIVTVGSLCRRFSNIDVKAKAALVFGKGVVDLVVDESLDVHGTVTLAGPRTFELTDLNLSPYGVLYVGKSSILKSTDDSESGVIKVSEGRIISQGGKFKSKFIIEREAMLNIDAGKTVIEAPLVIDGHLHFGSPVDGSLEVNGDMTLGVESILQAELDVDAVQSQVDSSSATLSNEHQLTISLLKALNGITGQFNTYVLGDLLMCLQSSIDTTDNLDLKLQITHFDCLADCLQDTRSCHGVEYHGNDGNNNFIQNIWDSMTKDAMSQTAVLSGVIFAMLFLLGLCIPGALKKLCCWCCMKPEYEKLNLDG